MKNYLVIFIALGIYLNTFGQEKIKYEVVYFEDNSTENTLGKFNLVDAVAEKEFIKGRLKVTNYTDKTLVIKPTECAFSSPQGDVNSRDKWLIIAPHQQDSKVIDSKGYNMKTTTTALKINGLYICNKIEINKAQEMSLPPQKEVKIGNFVLILDGWDRDGKEIMIKYLVKYLGDNVGMFTPNKVTLKSPEGGEYKNQKNKDDVFAFKKFDDKLVGFLYLSDSKKDNVINWNEAFSEGTLEKAENTTIEVKMNLPKTKDRN